MFVKDRFLLRPNYIMWNLNVDSIIKDDGERLKENEKEEQQYLEAACQGHVPLATLASPTADVLCCSASTENKNMIRNTSNTNHR